MVMLNPGTSRTQWTAVEPGGPPAWSERYAAAGPQWIDVRLEYAAASTEGRFSGAAYGAPGAWAATVDHTPLRRSGDVPTAVRICRLF
jgi:hypothetical protein